MAMNFPCPEMSGYVRKCPDENANMRTEPKLIFFPSCSLFVFLRAFVSRRFPWSGPMYRLAPKCFKMPENQRLKCRFCRNEPKAPRIHAEAMKRSQDVPPFIFIQINRSFIDAA